MGTCSWSKVTTAQPAVTVAQRRRGRCSRRRRGRGSPARRRRPRPRRAAAAGAPARPPARPSSGRAGRRRSRRAVGASAAVTGKAGGARRQSLLAAYGDRLHESRTRGPVGPAAAGSRTASSGSSSAVCCVDDHPVAAGHAGQPGGHVDRRAEDVAEPHHHGPAGQADPDVGHPGVAADDGDDPLGDVVGPRSGRRRTNSTESPSALDDPAALARRRRRRSGTRRPRPGRRSAPRSSSLDSAVKLTMSAKPTVSSDGVQVLLVGAERLHPGDGGGEVAAPGVDEQLLERLG